MIIYAAPWYWLPFTILLAYFLRRIVNVIYRAATWRP